MMIHSAGIPRGDVAGLERIEQLWASAALPYRLEVRQNGRTGENNRLLVGGANWHACPT